MSFSDIFKSSFLENVTSVSILDMVIALVLAFGVGVFIFFIYKKTFRGVMYSASFGVTLIALTMISTLVILAVTSNIVLSLGMVGALSIVRFRTAIKEPLDIAYLFWSIAVGIVLAAGLIPLAVFGSAAIGLMLVLFVNRTQKMQAYMISLHCASEAAAKAAMAWLEKQTQKVVVKSRVVRPDRVDINCEVRLKGEDTSFMDTASQIPGLRDAVLVSLDSEYGS